MYKLKYTIGNLKRGELFPCFGVVMLTILGYKADMEKRPMNTPKGCKAEITYPCRWQYKIIGLEAQGIRDAVAMYVKDPAYRLEPSNVSSGGRYVSMNLEVTVQNEEERLDLYNQLADHRDVKVVL